MRSLKSFMKCFEVPQRSQNDVVFAIHRGIWTEVFGNLSDIYNEDFLRK